MKIVIIKSWLKTKIDKNQINNLCLVIRMKRRTKKLSLNKHNILKCQKHHNKGAIIDKPAIDIWFNG